MNDCDRILELEALLKEEQQYRATWAARAIKAESALAALGGGLRTVRRGIQAVQIDLEGWIQDATRRKDSDQSDGDQRAGEG